MWNRIYNPIPLFYYNISGKLAIMNEAIILLPVVVG